MDAYLAYTNALTCLGSGVDLWYRLLEGRSGLTAAQDVYPDWFPSNESHIGAISNLDPGRSRLRQILEMLGNTIFPKSIQHCQAVLGASSLGDLTGRFAGDPYGCMKYYFETTHPNLAPRFKGVISSACSSGTDVLSVAAMLVSEKKYDIVGVLAADCLDPGKLLQHFALGTQAPWRAMPFDQDRAGTSFGEGGAFAIVANSAGMTTLQIEAPFQIRGFGMSCDAKHVTAPDETAEIPSLAMIRALECSGCSPSEIRYINAHASGTRLNDRVEALALRKAFGDALDDIWVSGTKGAIGHLLGSTGLVEVTITCWALQHGTAPGTVGLRSKDPSLNVPVIEEGKTQPIAGTVAMSTTFGFGGVNSAIVIEKTLVDDRK